MQQLHPRKEKALALGRTFFVAAAMASCRPDGEPKVPDRVQVMEHLLSPPAGLSEEIGSPDSKYPLKGLIAECRGKPECNIPVYPGSILLNLRIVPEYGGNLEISFSKVELDGIVLKMRVDFSSAGGASEAFQKLEYGQSGNLFNTDLVVTPLRGPNGTVSLSVRL